MSAGMNESALEQAALDWFLELGYEYVHGAHIAPDLPAPGAARQAGGESPEPACASARPADADRSHADRRDDYGQIVLVGRLRDALTRINSGVPDDAIEGALRMVTRPDSPSLIVNNRAFHRMITDGIPVEYRLPSPRPSPRERGGKDAAGDGGSEIKHDLVRLLDNDNIDNNEFLVVNQFTVIEDLSAGQAGKKNPACAAGAAGRRRPDIVVFVNGLPLAVIELKNPVKDVDERDPKKALRPAYNQFQTYKADIPGLFVYNELLVISDGFAALAGTLTSGWDRFMPWRTISGAEHYLHPIPLPPTPLPGGEGGTNSSLGPLQLGEGGQRPGEGCTAKPALEVLLKGVFERHRFLDYIFNFVTFEDDGKEIAKKAAAYHQYWAVNKAVECTVEASRPDGDRRIGVVWHTQGSGKSLSMAFYGGKVIKHPAMENPTLVVITDRNDLDDQLFGTFSVNSDLLRQTPVQAESREHLKDLLRVASGGVVFTTLQKFEGGDALSDRRNIVVIADEAHRSHYGFSARLDKKSGEIKYGMAKYLRDTLPNASFIGFTGTPIELDDKSTPAVFGDYIDKYDILRAVEDHATVPIYYESRLAKLELSEEEKPRIDPEFEEITEGEEEEEKHKLKTKWAALEAMVGTEKRIGLVARDVVDHFEKRLQAMDGKAMIVCMSRRICVEMYNAITRLRPQWHSDDDEKGVLKIVMSGSASDEPSWQSHIRTKAAREAIAKRFKDSEDGLKVVIVRDM
ncbi:MAG: type I restriction endonuclease subunit R, partial [Deltaproteobacteria bacterium]|nr:type I restriction endonuclease subunit R [Deltaproteobacteria bacterium]